MLSAQHAAIHTQMALIQVREENIKRREAEREQRTSKERRSEKLKDVFEGTLMKTRQYEVPFHRSSPHFESSAHEIALHHRPPLVRLRAARNSVAADQEAGDAGGGTAPS